MSAIHRLMVVLGLLVVLATALFPPRRHVHDTGLTTRVFLFSPRLYQSDISNVTKQGYTSSPAEIDFSRLILTWVIVGMIAAVGCVVTSQRNRASGS